MNDFVYKHFMLNDQLITYKFYVKNVKSLRMYLNKANELICVTPSFINEHTLNQFINKAMNKLGPIWLAKQKDLATDQIEIFDQKYQIKIIKATRNSYELINNVFYLKSSSVANQAKIIEKIYHDFCFAYVKKQCLFYAKQMNVIFKSIAFKNVNSYWGQCTKNNELFFSFNLLKQNQAFIDAIIVHELCHIKHKHHQKAFWQMVFSYYPNYQMVIRQNKKKT